MLFRGFLALTLAAGATCAFAANAPTQEQVVSQLVDLLRGLKDKPEDLAAALAEVTGRIAKAGENEGRIAALQKKLEEKQAEIQALTQEIENVRNETPVSSETLKTSLELLEKVKELPVAGPVQAAPTAAAPAPAAPPAAPAPIAPPAVVAAAATPTVFTDEQKLFFERRVLAVLQGNCFECHGPNEQKSGQRLDSRQGMLTGGKRGPSMVPGDPANSHMILAVKREGELKMPPDGVLTGSDIQALSDWIQLGAPWPDGASVEVNAPAPAAPKPGAPAAAAPTVAAADGDVVVAPAALRVEVQQPPASAGAGLAAAPQPVLVTPVPNGNAAPTFNRDIRPIFSNYCYACHGPDERARKEELRLDDENIARKVLEGANRGETKLWKRITNPDLEERMPPREHGKELTPEQIETIGKWIDAGAKWEQHWSFIKPVRPFPEALISDPWSLNPIDQFVLAAMHHQGLSPSPPASKEHLIRRATLDVTGLPPTLEEVDAFLADESDDAYEKVIDRLLASPRYGENMARSWLDLSRYADTNGYHIDNERYMWRWRDWVIEAFNKDQPFDQFTVEQIAGDLLPNPSLDQLVATGFNRNHMINFEGGAIPEEYRVQYVNDRLDATSTVWMGLTVHCAQCHDHKFDPITNRDYYQMYAFFNQVPEEGLDGRDGNAKPFVKAPLPEQTAKLAELESLIAAVKADRDKPNPELEQKQAAWEAEWSETLKTRWIPLTPKKVVSTGGAEMIVDEKSVVSVGGTNPDKDVYEFVAKTDLTAMTGVRIEALTDPALNGHPGRSDNGNFVLTEFEIEAAPATDENASQRLELTTAMADFAQDKYETALAIDGNSATGWGVNNGDNKSNHTAVFVPSSPFGSSLGTVVRIRLKHESAFAHHAMGRFRISVTQDPAMTPAALGPWYVAGPYKAYDGKAAYETAFDPEKIVDLQSTYDDGRYKWVKILDGFKDGQINKLDGDVAATYLYREITTPNERPFTLALGSNDALKVWLNGSVVLDKNVERQLQKDQDKVEVRLAQGMNTLLVKVVNYGNEYAFYFNRAGESLGAIPFNIELALAQPLMFRSDEEFTRLSEYYRTNNSEEWRAFQARVAELEAERAATEAAIPTVMVMAQLETPRDTFMLTRGQYDQPGEKVEAATPSSLPPLPEGAPANRLGYAEWLVSPEHPLTARVAVNRYWERYFGRGIVKTPEDFGSQGAWPTHPELLDWLAVEFVESGWDVKHMQRLILTSATYRQSSKVTKDLLERDRENIYLARGPRLRLDAESVRDNALAVSGLLVGKIGGPSVKPYQPAGLWEEVGYGGDFTAQRFTADTGEDLYRRSMYTFWKRTAPPPTMMLFDAPNRETCSARRASTNTPLQALALMNDPQFVEASRKMAERVIRAFPDGGDERIKYAFRIVTARWPEERELRVLRNVYEDEVARFKGEVDGAKAYIDVGDSPVDESIDPCELAAWTTLASTILNLDEAITKS